MRSSIYKWACCARRGIGNLSKAAAFPVSDEWLGARINNLPFALTSAQQTALDELRADLDSGKPMNRLLQGDVGSGKTVVAALGASMAVNGGAQAAIMAPTSILAEQHLPNLHRSAQRRKGIFCRRVRFVYWLVIRLKRRKRRFRQDWQMASVRIVIGTHAVIEAPVQFKDLQFVVIDEQHRFGVEQRAELRSKGTNPHLLVMTATPSRARSP